MTDQNNPFKRSVSNQLFNASVIGATIDDFSRNAVLFPVRDINTNTVADINQNGPKLSTIHQTIPNSSGTIPLSNTLNPATTAASNPSVGLPPTGQSSNLYRRSTTKKVTYAQIPGLVSSHHQPHDLTNISDQNHPIQPPQNIEQPQTWPNYFNSVPKSFQNVSTPSGILTPETSSPSLLHLSTHPPPTSSALLTPTIPSELSAQYGHSDHLSNFSSSINPAFYGEDVSSGQRIMGMTPYRPAYHHWFYNHIQSGESIWIPFSMPDSLSLEAAFTSPDLSPETIVATDGNRHDVNILRRERYAVYWDASPSEVRRCSWFVKTNVDSKFTPYEENVAALLEAEYKVAFERNEWNRVINLPNSETILFQGPDMLVRLPPNPITDNWGSPATSPAHHGLLKRSMDEFDIHEGESNEIDHVIFVVHGIGPGCDFQFRSVQEVVDDFRRIALKFMSSHFHSSPCNRVEVLPISWHGSLHSEETGVDQLLKNITLKSIPALRDFTNNTLLDILFYTSPIYSQTIITSITTNLNRLYNLFQVRNPTFKGGVSLIGHSLGSLILFDILSHEIAQPEEEVVTEVVERTVDEDEEEDEEEVDDIVTELKPMKKKMLGRRISKMMLEAGAQPVKITYPHLNFQPTALYALGSPIGMFMTVRGLDKFGPDFALPTCTYFYNVFHPHDPVAYRIEPLINQELSNLKPALIPHHMGRKRMHLELQDTFQRVSVNIKEKVVGSMVNAIRRLYTGKDTETVDDTVDKSDTDSGPETTTSPPVEETNQNFGILNRGHRIDYALQESPFEVINEYISAVRSHVCYWCSEDTVLFILSKTYGTMGITPSSPPQE